MFSINKNVQILHLPPIHSISPAIFLLILFTDGGYGFGKEQRSYGIAAFPMSLPVRISSPVTQTLTFPVIRWTMVRE